MRVLIVGCGYVGLPVGMRLAERGHEVFGLRRSSGDEAALEKVGVRPLTGDITDPASLRLLPGPFDWVVNTVSSSRGGVEVYRRVYVEGTRNLLEVWPGVKKYVYTSSTSVYGQTDGSWVDETSATLPGSATSQVLVEAEQILLGAARASAFPGVVLRVAGIYGPGRGHLFLQYLRDEARLHGDGTRLLNMVHLDDVAGAVVLALAEGRPGEVYNVADDEPVTQRDFFSWLSARLGKPMPPVAGEEEWAQRKRGTTNKGVSNRKLKEELGWRLIYPTFREGYNAEMERLRAAGLLAPSP